MNHLMAWRESQTRKPLILRGARQVGKSWLIKEFGRQFESFVELNFEKDKSLHALFEGDVDVKKLLERLALRTNKLIKPGQTLIFFDEIQECPNALTFLRYFKEELPEYHVIAAGSLLDFILDKTGMPVGRVEFMYLYPLSFGEFLTALGYDRLRDHIESQLMTQPIDLVIHKQILEILQVYFWLGGMPTVVDAWIKFNDVALCQKLQKEIIDAYYQDFQKYAKRRQIDYVEKMFASIPQQLGGKFKFSYVSQDIQAKYLKTALEMLEKAGIAHLCYHTSSQAQPLGAEKNEKKFKVYFFDIGIAYRLLGNVTRDWVFEAFKNDNHGYLIEQFVAQELTAYSFIHSKDDLFYWHREARQSNAEVDFVISHHGEIVPIEVKSGKTGTLRSLHQFLQAHPHVKYGLKISSHPYSQQDNLVEIPLYGIAKWLASEEKK